jgi:hypothetical protein
VISTPLIQNCLSHCSSTGNFSLKNRLSLHSPLSPYKYQTTPCCVPMLHYPNSKRLDAMPWIIIQRFITIFLPIQRSSITSSCTEHTQLQL